MLKNLRSFIDHNHKPIGIIPHKLMSVYYTPIFKEHDYITRHTPLIEDFQSKIESLRTGNPDLPTIDQRISAMYNVLPVIKTEIVLNDFSDVPLAWNVEDLDLSQL